MKSYTYQNTLISKKQLKQILAWGFSKYGSIKACFLADELKSLGFKYATQAGISISIEDLRVPFVKKSMLNNSNQEILTMKKNYIKGKVTEVEQFQKLIDTWNLTSELLKDEIISFFNNYDPLNSVYIMAFSGARGNLSQVRQLIGMRGLMADPSGAILNLPITKNFQEGLTVTDYLISGYGARKGIVDTALKTANAGYLTRRLIDVAQDIIIREKDCMTSYSFFLFNKDYNSQIIDSVNERILGRLINKPIYDPKTNELIAEINTQITPNLIRTFKQKKVEIVYIRSPLTCSLYRSICQKCYGWDLASENLVDMGEAIGIIAGQSIGEPGTQLTMRTFHTGGVFTSKAVKQLLSPIDGFISFSNSLKASQLRTNRGEKVFLTKNASILSILKNKNDEKESCPIKLEIPGNSLLFLQNDEYIKQNQLIAQLPDSTKHYRSETKYIFSDLSGEIFIPRLNLTSRLTNKNKLFWVFSGQVYRAPVNSFINFYLDYRINKNNYIFRSKIINQHSGFITLLNDKEKLFQQIIEIKSCIYSLNKNNCNVQQLSYKLNTANYLLTIENQNYFLNLELKDSKILIPTYSYTNFATLVTNEYKSLVGGTPYFNQKINQKNISYPNNFIYYLSNLHKRYYKTLVWLPEETHELNVDLRVLLIEPNTLISENFEIIPNVYSRTSGIVKIQKTNKTVNQISIKPGILYISESIENLDKQVFYPGEIILDSIKITQPSVCEVIYTKVDSRLLIRPIEIYEIPIKKPISNKLNLNSVFFLTNHINYLFDSGQKIRKNTEFNLLTNTLDLNLKNSLRRNVNIGISVTKNHKNKSINFLLSERLHLIDYLVPSLRYTNINSCLIVEPNQYIEAHTVLGYLEQISFQSLQLIKFKSKNARNKDILLISNNDCVIMKKDKLKKKYINDIIINDVNINQIGKVILDNEKFVVIQKGRPYFFPNCKHKSFINDTNIKYRWIPEKPRSNKDLIYTKNNINLNYYDIIKKSTNYLELSNVCKKFEFTKMFLKKRGKYYISSLPIFVREFLIKKEGNSNTKLSKLKSQPWLGYLDNKNYKNSKQKFSSSSTYIQLRHIFMLFMKSSELKSKKINKNKRFEFASVGLLGYPFKSIGIHSVTEDYFEEEVNSVFCKHGDFLENGQPIGSLKFEKEITGDIVQGLPRIEQLLEARRKKYVSKYTAKNHQKGLLIRKTTIDENFKFRKIGTTIKENDGINPHSLLKVYFNYYAEIKYLNYGNNKKILLSRLANNYEASYLSFKKIQLLILNSVQSVYKSQGVIIADKHLEIMIKQMTTKVLITHEGQTPLLPREVIDLYHIKYINEVVKIRNKQPAYYVPLLLGITKAALNNPSFISAASFQETTRVLTKAAIEGRLDWLRGLKENIIIGHSIPAGTGSKNYRNSFNKSLIKKNKIESAFCENDKN